METLWYAIVTVMLAGYVLLDGFDFGTGIIYLFVGRSEAERRMALHAIEPVLHGNEVWLIASAGLLFFSFPRAYAAGFSGFYLALIMVLWLLILRGVSLALRSQLSNPLWRDFWDWGFAAASVLLAVVFGTALGNLVRGVPLDADGYFFTAFWTDFLPGRTPGILDWYTALMGVEGAAVLTVHGATYLAMKTAEEVQQRARRIARAGFWVVTALTLLAILAIPVVQPGLRRNYAAHSAGYLLPVLAGLALVGLFYFLRRQRDVAAFAASSLFIGALLGSTAWGMFPNLLISTIDPAYSLTVANAAAPPHALRLALVWFGVGFGLIVLYSLYAYRAFWGKVEAADHGAP
jgi:cytochrome d ubiquinol oxidase subunit II